MWENLQQTKRNEQEIIIIDNNNFKYYKDSVFNAYKDIFGGKPFYESFTENELEDIFKKFLSDDTIFILKTNLDQAIAFAIGIPLEEYNKDTILLLSDEIDTDSSFYIAEVGVTKEFRGCGIGSELFSELVNQASLKAKYSNFVLRTSPESLMVNTCKKFDFKLLDVTQTIQQTRQNGEIEDEQRAFYAKFN